MSWTNASAYTHRALRGAGGEGLVLRLTHQRLSSLVRDIGLTPASVVVAALDPAGPTVALDPGLSLYPASMIKVPLVAAALATIAEGPLEPALEATFEVKPQNMTTNDDESPLRPGYTATLRELMHLAIARSDNVATNELLDIVGRARATAIARERFGLHDTAFHRKLSGSEPLIDDPAWDGAHRNRHTAGDAAALFGEIARERIPHAGLLREMLAAQAWNDKLTRGLCDGDRFAHKTGDTSDVTHDGGILVTNEGRTYAVVVYTGLRSSEENNARFGPFMRAVRELL